MSIFEFMIVKWHQIQKGGWIWYCWMADVDKHCRPNAISPLHHTLATKHTPTVSVRETYWLQTSFGGVVPDVHPFQATNETTVPQVSGSRCLQKPSRFNENKPADGKLRLVMNNFFIEKLIFVLYVRNKYTNEIAYG